MRLFGIKRRRPTVAKRRRWRPCAIRAGPRWARLERTSTGMSETRPYDGTCRNPYEMAASSIPAHKVFHAMQGFFDFLVGRRIAGTHEAFAAWTERVTRHNRHVFLLQQPLAERFIVHA